MQCNSIISNYNITGILCMVYYDLLLFLNVLLICTHMYHMYFSYINTQSNVLLQYIYVLKCTL